MNLKHAREKILNLNYFVIKQFIFIFVIFLEALIK